MRITPLDNIHAIVYNGWREGRSDMPTFTKLETEIIQHRLGVPECIADALEEYSREDVEAECFNLQRGIVEFDLTQLLHRDILAECVEGSTFYGAAVGNETPQKLASIERACESLADKVSKALGRKIIFPLH